MYGFSGNDIHAYMDRFAKELRHAHRNKGHDVQTLIEMCIIFKHKYTQKQIMQTWMLHNAVDQFDSNLKTSIKNNYTNYGKKKDTTLKDIERLQKKLFK